MSKVIDTIAILGALGITGYFIYKVILPNLKDFQFPVFQPPPFPTFQFPQPPPPPQQYVPPSAPEPSGDGGGGDEEQEPAPSVPKAAAPAPPSTVPGGGTVEGGIKLVYKTTGQKAALPTSASAHENGDRYSVNHKFINYIILAYLKGNHNAQGCKMDGPNHGKCQSKKPDCFWIDPDLQMSNGSIKYGAEYPHPKANSVPCPSCKAAGTSLSGKWYGYQGICYQGSGGPSDRWNEVWVDVGAGANGEPGNKWVNLLKENYTKNIPADWRRPNGLPVNCSDCGSGTGLEAEIRMRGGSGTSIKYGAVYEIVSPAGGGGGTPTTAQIRRRMLNEPYLFNGYYNRRRL
jgi:hypothetical protein